jgi:hypothetical protein
VSNDKEFLNGLVVKIRENQPEFVLCNLSIRVEDLIATLERERGAEWLNAVIKRGRSGKYYAEIDRWKPTEKLADVARARPAPAPAREEFDSEIPF